MSVRGRGLSLVETLIAFFLLSCGVLLITQLFLYSLRYTRQVEARARGLLAGERAWQRLRNWASEVSGGQLNFSGNWAAYSGVTETDPDDADFQLHYEVADEILMSPCREFESLIPADQQGLMARSAKRVSIDVRWRGGSLLLAGLVEEPPRQWRATNPLVVSGTPPDPVDASNPANFTVTAFDSNDAAIEDLEFRWYVDAMSTSGTVTPSQNGKAATFTPLMTLSDGSTQPSPPGQCRVKVRAVYRGQERTALSAVMNVAP